VPPAADLLPPPNGVNCRPSSSRFQNFEFCILTILLTVATLYTQDPVKLINERDMIPTPTMIGEVQLLTSLIFCMEVE
jgi:hypothetical protein